MTPFPFREVATGIESISASFTISGPAEEAVAPPPATITGHLAFSKTRATCRTSSSLGSSRIEG